MKRNKILISIMTIVLLVFGQLGNITKVEAQTNYSNGYLKAYNVVYSGLVANHCISDLTVFLMMK